MLLNMRIRVTLMGLLCAYCTSASPVPEAEPEAQSVQSNNFPTNVKAATTEGYGLYGLYVGSFSDPQNVGITGDVYVVNKTCIQILGFTYKADAPDLYFWLEKGSVLSSAGYKIPTFEYGDKALNTYSDARVVLELPVEHRVTDFQTFGLWCHSFNKVYGAVALPINMELPKPFLLNGTIAGNVAISRNYGVKSGPVLVLDSRTIKVFAFSFNGDQAPDGNFLVGKGDINPENGVRVGIRGKDEPDSCMNEICGWYIHHYQLPIHVFNRRGTDNAKELPAVTHIDRRYTGQDVILELPESHDALSIEWISVYCIRFRVNFGDVKLGKITQQIPAYVPVQKRYDDAIVERKPSWAPTTLIGTAQHTNFTFQLGPPGGRRAYEAWAEARPNEYVWYVNGYMSPELVLQRGVNYNFIVQGGDDSSTVHFYNPLYISNEPFGGYMKLPEDDRKQIKIFAGLNSLGKPMLGRDGTSSGSLCYWSQVNPNDNPDVYDDFKTYSDQLKLSCEKGKSGSFKWTPTADTPDTVYYQSYTSYYMGHKIMITDEIPSDLTSASDIPFDYEIWLEANGQNFVKVPRSADASKSGHLMTSSTIIVGLCSLLVLLLRL